MDYIIVTYYTVALHLSDKNSYKATKALELFDAQSLNNTNNTISEKYMLFNLIDFSSW